jgi:hypothetical protein
VNNLDQTKADAAAARRRLEGRVAEIRERTRPQALLADVKTATRKRAIHAAVGALANTKTRPIVAAGVAAAAIAYLFKTPILNALRTRMAKENNDEQ